MDNKTQQETKENKNEVVLDISYLINSREVVENGKIGIFTDADAFNDYVKCVITLSNTASMEMTTPKMVAMLGESKGKKLSRYVEIMHISQQFHNVYPIYDYNILSQFRDNIFEGIVYNLAIKGESPEVFEDVKEQFIDDEIKACKIIYSSMSKILRSPEQRMLLYEFRSVVKSYLKQLNIDLNGEEETEEQQVEPQIKYDYPIETLIQFVDVISCASCKDKYAMINNILNWYKNSKGGEARRLAHIFIIFACSPLATFHRVFKSVGLTRLESASAISNAKNETDLSESMLLELKEIKKKHS